MSVDEIRRAASEDFKARPCPEPTVDQLRRVGQIVRAADSREVAA